MSECVHKVLPVFNRCVVFTTSDDSWHGHPDPLACPQGMTRKSIATYYYTSFTQPEELSEFRRTNFRARSQSGDGAAAPSGMERRLKAAARAVLPPIFADRVKRLRRKK